MNDITLNYKKINKCLPAKKKPKDRGYFKQEIAKLLSIADLRMKVVILLMSSSALRIGAFHWKDSDGESHYLQLKHLKKMAQCRSCGTIYRVKALWEKEEDEKWKQDGQSFQETCPGCITKERIELYLLNVYDGEPEEYTAVVSPEGMQAVDNYLGDRMLAGREDLTPETPLIRDAYARFKPYGEIVRSLTKSGIKSTLHGLLKQAGLRVPNEPNPATGRYDKRHPIKIDHGFRKSWNTAMTNAKMNRDIREALMGWQAGKRGLQENYYRPRDEELIGEYLKLVHHVTIQQDAVLLAKKNEELLRRLKDSEAEKQRIHSLEQKVEVLGAMVEAFTKSKSSSEGRRVTKTDAGILVSYLPEEEAIMQEHIRDYHKAVNGRESLEVEML